MSGACSSHGETRNTYTILVGKPEGYRTLGRLRRGWEGNITRLEYTDIPEAFFKGHHVGRRCTNTIRGHIMS
jgi:hypothetical protein